MKTVVTVICFGALILIADLMTPGIFTSEWQDVVWIINCRECNEVWCTVIGGAILGYAWREWENTHVNSKYLLSWLQFELSSLKHKTDTRVGTLIVATIYLQLIQNRYMFRSFTVLQCSHQHCLQPVASDV